MCLSIKEIKEEMENKNIVIKPFSESSLTPNGYELRIKKINDCIIGSPKEYTIKKGQVISIVTLESLKLSNGIRGIINYTDNYSDKGLGGAVIFIPSGFNGKIDTKIMNFSKKDIIINLDEAMFNIVFSYEKTKTPLVQKLKKAITLS